VGVVWNYPGRMKHMAHMHKGQRLRLHTHTHTKTVTIGNTQEHHGSVTHKSKL
jgi:hypothetical protein